MLQIQVKVADMEPVKEIMHQLSDLIEQIEISEFKDENGNQLKTNFHYQKIIEGIKELEGLADE
ncbi:hypothetical protein FLK61_34140 [Paenalkalicoccus suaedae]|uniref:Uncharacterized protein n=1 Tax=Paenalkalicoccus suaedae TaxID=2592382 RepID=A0A859FFE8_9BACI|nr:hypothetical protein [Paenalkalicoccus suaedae]QKS71668.1 hypothetical protein FLK61_33845 [Paenalkalicoccus suaedae]QKS71721.1 hypothetical protein FLK61_34140 [Paenalkalicoccus suaedae]